MIVLLLLALVLLLGASTIALAGISGKQTASEINYQQAYTSAKSALEIIIGQFEKAKTDNELQEDFTALAKSMALDDQKEIGITLPPEEMGTANATLTCIEYSDSRGACSLMKVSVTATYKNKSRTVSANMKATFIDNLAQITTPLTTFMEQPDFEPNGAGKYYDDNGNMLHDEDEILTVIDSELMEDGAFTVAGQRSFDELIEELYEIKEDKLVPCKKNDINASCLLNMPYYDSYFKYELSGKERNVMLMRYKDWVNSTQLQSGEFTVKDAEEGTAYTLLLKDESLSSGNLVFELGEKMQFVDDGDVRSPFLLLYNGKRPLEIRMYSQDTECSFNGWILAPNSSVSIVNNLSNGNNGYTIHGGVIAKEFKMEGNNFIYYVPPSFEVQALMGIFEGGSSDQYKMEWRAIYD